MAATIIDGRAIAAQVRADVAAEIERFTRDTGTQPGLATILVGDDPASAIYVAGKQKACAEVGIAGFDHRPPAEVTQEELHALIRKCNDDPRVSGILLQLPLPAHLDADALVESISPVKDVDGLTAHSAGLLAQGRPGMRPCTPSGVLELLDRHEVELSGAAAVIVGRSMLVGKPLSALLLARDATVTTCHSRTRGLAAVCARADVLVAAVGVARLIGPEHVKEGAVVIDVGMNRTTGGLAGDVDFDAVADRTSAITPVPGGVGPMTIAMLMRNTLAAAVALAPAAQPTD